jgi:subtilase family serine protease
VLTVVVTAERGKPHDRGAAVGRYQGRLLQLIAMSVALAALSVATATASISRVRVGSSPVLPAGVRVQGALAGSTPLKLTVALRSQDASGLQSFAAAVSTPGSPLFRHYLTVSQFAQQFGATALQVATVESALRAQGLDVGAVTANNLTIPVTGSAAQVEKALSVALAQVKLPGGRTAYANAQAPVLPQSVGRYVLGVIGLDNVHPDQPAGLAKQSRLSPQLPHAFSRPHVPTGGPQPCPSATAQQGHNGLTADEVATAYQFSGLYGAGDLGAGQTIAMFEQQPYSPNDIASYQACYGTSASVSNIDVAGGPGVWAGDDGESALDIEQAIGLAPKANILVYQGPSTATVQIISQIVSDDRAKVISSSYGVCEALAGGTVVNAESPLLQEAAAQGQSFFISSGDSGSSMCYQADHNNTSLSVINPGGQPFATGVGGTTLFTNTSSGNNCPCFYHPGDPLAEGVWNGGVSNNRASGTGGGISSFFAMPSYQSSAAGSLGVINSNSSRTPCASASFCREVPDVSADADPNTGYVVFSSSGGNPPSWGITGGTSAAAPLWAAFTALANASGTCRGTPVGFVNPALYQIAGGSYLNNFNDVTQPSPFTGAANNDAIGANNGLYPVGTAYDMATGLGSMIAPHLAAALCSLASPVYTVSVKNPGSQQTIVGHGAALHLSGSDSGGVALTYQASGLPTGLSINASTGVISGTPTIAQSTVVTVSASDQFTNVGSTHFTWTIASGKPGAKMTLSGIASRKPKLSFKLSAGSNAPALKSVSISLPSGLSFAKKAKTLAAGLKVQGSKFTAKLKHGVLTISFKKSLRNVTITLGRPAVSVSGSLASKVMHHKVKRLTVTLRATNTSNQTTRISVKLKAK